ncbi:response regulator [Aliiglaciecola sp. CAU 1673]|uniref:response regulator n=1 Tax=Aliiglaciecola sp. CAU 1673 TaxID=3032595 RepID=UPI0023DB6EF2|nr:response regulator [Aliiglaciecola sp. CAU 1673]MDF2180106.1 response regulator [Aliiglaciecola sp. CAU 1673]
MPKLLIVEDEQKLAGLLADYFGKDGFEVTQRHEGSGVVAWCRQHEVDAILLDLMLPGMDGLEICRQLRQFSAVPILMLTARVEEIDRLLGLELGADDYICKPFSPREVVARVKAVLRRTQGNILQQRPWQLDADRLEVRAGEHCIQLTAIEFHILSLLAAQPGRIYSRSQLMDAMYQDHRVVSERTIDSHIKKLRKKLEECQQQLAIQSVYGVGYRLEVQ